MSSITPGSDREIERRALSDFVKKMWLSAGLLVGLLLIGTIGFALLGRGVFHSFYITVVILTTVGMEGAETDAERAFSLFLMIVGVGVVIYATGVLVAAFVDGEVRAMLGRRKLMQQINKLTGHYIIVGYGRMGHALCTTLQYKDAPFVLIESDPVRAQEARDAGFLIYEGDAMQEQTLLVVGIDRAVGLASCLPKDADNLYVVLTARGMNEKLHIVAREEQLASEVKLRRAGANRVVCPPLIGAGRITDLLTNPRAEEMLELDGHWPDLELSKLSLAEFPGGAGLPLKQVYQNIGHAVIVAAVVSVDGSRQFNPTPEYELRAGDQLVIIGPGGSLGQTINYLDAAKAA